MTSGSNFAYACCNLMYLTAMCLDFTDDEIKIVTAPPFAESVSEGDVRWEKGKRVFYSDTIVIITYLLPTYFSCC